MFCMENNLIHSVSVGLTWKGFLRVMFFRTVHQKTVDVIVGVGDVQFSQPTVQHALDAPSGKRGSEQCFLCCLLTASTKFFAVTKKVCEFFCRPSKLKTRIQSASEVFSIATAPAALNQLIRFVKFRIQSTIHVSWPLAHTVEQYGFMPCDFFLLFLIELSFFLLLYLHYFIYTSRSAHRMVTHGQHRTSRVQNVHKIKFTSKLGFELKNVVYIRLFTLTFSLVVICGFCGCFSSTVHLKRMKCMWKWFLDFVILGELICWCATNFRFWREKAFDIVHMGGAHEDRGINY